MVRLSTTTGNGGNPTSIHTRTMTPKNTSNKSQYHTFHIDVDAKGKGPQQSASQLHSQSQSQIIASQSSAPLSRSTAHNIQNLERSLSSFTHKLHTDAQEVASLVQKSTTSAKRRNINSTNALKHLPSSQQAPLAPAPADPAPADPAHATELTQSEWNHHRHISLKFLTLMKNRCDAVESELVPLTDIALGKIQQQQGHQGQEEPLASLQEVADACQYLHGHSAKELIHLEEIMNGYDGFVGPTSSHLFASPTTNTMDYYHCQNEQQDQEQQEQQSDETEDEMTLREFQAQEEEEELESYEDQEHEQEQPTRFQFSVGGGGGGTVGQEGLLVNEMVGQPLNRLSEVDAETDGGTPTSLYSLHERLEGARSKRSMDHGHDCSGDDGGGGSSIPLEFNSPPPVDQFKSDGEGQRVPTTPKTPTVASLRLSSVTASILARTDQVEEIDISVSYSESSVSSTSSNADEHEEEELQSCSQLSATKMNHEQCMELLENSKLCNESDLLDDDDDDDDESTIDEGYSLASTVICDRKLALNDGQFVDGTVLQVVEELDTTETRGSSGEYLEDGTRRERPRRNKSNVDVDGGDENTSFHLDEVTEAYSESSGNVSLSGQTTRSTTSELDPIEHVTSSHSDTTMTESDTCSTRTSMTSANSISRIDPESFMARMEDENVKGNTPFTPQLDANGSHIYSDDDDDLKYTPILDRFQVQVINGGSECRVTPIESDVLKSAQSPILRQKSPMPQEKILFRSPLNEEMVKPPRDTKFSDSVKGNYHKRLSTHTNPRQISNVITCDETESSVPVAIAIKEARVSNDISGNDSWKYNTKMSQKSNRESGSERSFTGEFSASAFLPNISNHNRLNESMGSKGLHQSRRSCGERMRTKRSNSSPVFISNRESHLSSKRETSHESTFHEEDTTQTCEQTFSKSNGVEKTEYFKKTPNNDNILQSPEEKAFARTPHAAAWIAKHMPKESDKLLQILSGERSCPDGRHKERASPGLNGRNMASDFASETERRPISISAKSSATRSAMGNTEIIPQLQREEYNDSPRIVRIQVEFDDVNSAIDLINKWIYDSSIKGGSLSISIKENTAYEILDARFDKKKCRSILMSLCHFRRLMMRLSSTSGEGKLFLIPNK